MLAVKKKNKQLIRMLMESGGVNALTAFDSQGRNALALAQSYGVADALQPFLPPSIQQLLLPPPPDATTGAPCSLLEDQREMCI